MEDSDRFLIGWAAFGLFCLALGVFDIVDQLVKALSRPAVADDVLRTLFGLTVIGSSIPS